MNWYNTFSEKVLGFGIVFIPRDYWKLEFKSEANISYSTSFYKNIIFYPYKITP